MTRRTTNIVMLALPWFRKSGGKTVNATYIKKALAKFQPIFKPKRPRLSSQNRFLYQDNASIHTAASVQEFSWRQRGPRGLGAG
jgi:hypothetical protein